MVNDDIYCTAITYVIPIIELFIAGCCLHMLAKPFMEDKRKAFYVGVTYSLTMLLLYIIPLQISYFTAYSIGSIAAAFLMCRLEQRNYKQKIFVAVTFFSIHWFAFAMAEILYDNLYSFAASTKFMANHPNMWFALYVAVCVVYLILGFLFTAIGILCILRAYTYKQTDMTLKELLIMVIPSFMGVAGYVIIGDYRIFYIGEGGKNSGIYDMVTILYYIAAVIAIVVIIVLYQDIKSKQEEKLQNELLATQLDGMRQHIEQVESLYQNIRSIKHDMTNHIITLERLYEGNKQEEARAYGTELKAALAQAAGRINSGNPVTDVILQEILREAEKRKIRFETDFHYPAGTNVNAFDISVILNNALQNAIENTTENIEGGNLPYIFIRSYRRNNAYMIEISNSFTGNLQWDSESGLPVTSKKKTDGHGYGLSNIRRVVGKYSGDIAIDLQDGMFCLSILLMMEQ